jgi:dethiobiotin synthetase
VGKTVVSAALVKAFGYEYWKPVQAGDLHFSDSKKVSEWSGGVIHPERYRLQLPMSPHQAAALENIHIQLSDFELPLTKNPLLVEGAGGLLVPLNDKGEYLIDLALKFKLPVVLVGTFYLGSINHTLMSLAMLEKYGLTLEHLILWGDDPNHSLRAIQAACDPEKIIHLPFLDLPEKEMVNHLSEIFRSR